MEKNKTMLKAYLELQIDRACGLRSNDADIPQEECVGIGGEVAKVKRFVEAVERHTRKSLEGWQELSAKCLSEELPKELRDLRDVLPPAPPDPDEYLDQFRHETAADLKAYLAMWIEEDRAGLCEEASRTGEEATAAIKMFLPYASDEEGNAWLEDDRQKLREELDRVRRKAESARGILSQLVCNDAKFPSGYGFDVMLETFQREINGVMTGAAQALLEEQERADRYALGRENLWREIVPKFNKVSRRLQDRAASNQNLSAENEELKTAQRKGDKKLSEWEKKNTSRFFRRPQTGTEPRANGSTQP